jgi:transcriptional regulator with XRE-family HTH domain
MVSGGGIAMTTLKNDRDFMSARKRLVKLRMLKRHTERFLVHLELEDSEEQMKSLNKDITDLESKLLEYIFWEPTDPFHSLTSISLVPKALIATRVWLGWTQHELAQRAGLSRKMIHNYERDQYKRTNVETVLRIASAIESEVVKRAASEKHRERFLPTFELSDAPLPPMRTDTSLTKGLWGDHASPDWQEVALRADEDREYTIDELDCFNSSLDSEPDSAPTEQSEHI